MQAGDDEAQTALWRRLGDTVRAALRRKSGMSLRDGDARRDNIDALDLYQDVMARLWERLGSDTDAARGEVGDLAAYAATVAHNAWSDHLRQRWPLRASLKNRLRYFLGHQNGYALWPGDHGQTLTGLHGWQLRPPGAATGSERPQDAAGADTPLARLLDGQAQLPRGSVPRQPMDRFDAADWHRLLGAIFHMVGAAVELDDLVALVARLIGLKEERVESLDELAERGDGALASETDGAVTPEQWAEVRSLLRQLWGALLALKWDYRCTYLLNPPGAGKARAELEVFLLHGIAGPADLEAALALQAPHYRHAFGGLGLPVPAPSACFAALWPALPLADALIARMLGCEPQQVINRRMLALRELARLMGHSMRRARTS